MRPAVWILHHDPGPDAGPLVRWLTDLRAVNAARLLEGFAAAGGDPEVLESSTDDTPFGARLRGLTEVRPGHEGLVVVGSGALPLATDGDLAAFVAVAASGERRALANDRFSADAVAVGRGDVLAGVPDLPGDNALPRWLAEVAGIPVADLRRRRRLLMDIDSPLDAMLVGAVGDAPPAIDLSVFTERLAGVRSAAGDRRAELVVAGRLGSATLRWLERSTASRTRALIEERGLRAATRLARADGQAAPRPPRSVLGLLLDHEGPAALGPILARLGDAAIVDTRVLLAHRLGADESRWPSAEDRFASDLLLGFRVGDPWLRALTLSAATAPIPVLLGGHSLVGPGIPYALAFAARTGVAVPA
jgi:hypothetical protein